MSHLYFPIRALLRRQQCSERGFAQKSGLSRALVRGIYSLKNVTLKSLEKVANQFSYQVQILVTPLEVMSEYSTVAAALLVERDGFESWKLHFFNLVDEFRRTLDVRLIILPPHKGFDAKLNALLASMVKDLTESLGIDTPPWAKKQKFLDHPWFVAGIENLKATALLESPLPYRANNIFVQNNFLSRA